MAVDYDDDEAMIDLELNGPVEPEQPSYQERSGTEKGLCLVCGKPTGDKRRKWCDEHTGQRKVKTGPRVSRDGKRGNSSTKGATNGELAGSLGKILVILTLILAWYQLRTRHIGDPNGDLAEHIAFSDDEAVAIARPFSRAINSSSTGIRLGKQLVDNSDLVDATFAIWQWYKRMTDTLDAASQGMAINRGNNRGTTRPVQQNSGDGGGPDIGGFDAEFEYVGD